MRSLNRPPAGESNRAGESYRNSSPQEFCLTGPRGTQKFTVQQYFPKNGELRRISETTGIRPENNRSPRARVVQDNQVQGRWQGLAPSRPHPLSTACLSRTHRDLNPPLRPGLQQVMRATKIWPRFLPKPTPPPPPPSPSPEPCRFMPTGHPSLSLAPASDRDVDRSTEPLRSSSPSASRPLRQSPSDPAAAAAAATAAALLPPPKNAERARQDRFRGRRGESWSFRQRRFTGAEG